VDFKILSKEEFDKVVRTIPTWQHVLAASNSWLTWSDIAHNVDRLYDPPYEIYIKVVVPMHTKLSRYLNGQ
jgi:hypothetical protein